MVIINEIKTKLGNLNYKKGIFRLWFIWCAAFSISYAFTHPRPIGESIGFEWGLITSDKGYALQKKLIENTSAIGRLCQRHMDGKLCSLEHKNTSDYSNPYDEIFEKDAFKGDANCWSDEGKNNFRIEFVNSGLFHQMKELIEKDTGEASDLKINEVDLSTCEAFRLISTPSHLWLVDLFVALFAPLIVWYALLFIVNGFRDKGRKNKQSATAADATQQK